MSYQYAGMFGPDAILTPSGVPAVNTSVLVNNHGTSSAAQLYAPTLSNNVSQLPVPLASSNYTSNPVATDAYGNLLFWAAPGAYDLVFTVGGVTTTRTVVVQPDPNETAWNTVVLRAAQSQVQTFNASSSANLIFQTTLEDTVSGYDATTGVYTPPSGGLYLVSIQVQVGSTPTNAFCYVYCAPNSNQSEPAPYTYTNQCYTITNFERITAGQTITPSLYNSASAAVSTSGNGQSFLLIARIGN